MTGIRPPSQPWDRYPPGSLLSEGMLFRAYGALRMNAPIPRAQPTTAKASPVDLSRAAEPVRPLGVQEREEEPASPAFSRSQLAEVAP